MTDDFLRLVSQANPAARQQYQPTNNGYPPSSSAGLYTDAPSPSQPQLLDPFFDDDDDNAPDSAFGRPGPMHSQESGLPLSSDPAPYAGTRQVKAGDGVPQGWAFDDDDFISGDKSFQGSSNFSKTPNITNSPTPSSKKKRWRWPWQKEVVPTGERVIALNNPDLNQDFCNNAVSTSKYNVVTFIPKFLTGALSLSFYIPVLVNAHSTEQFSRYANIFFLFTAAIQQIPNVSPTNQYTTIAPLAAVLLATAFKEVQEDMVSPESYCSIECLYLVETA
jgi:phospholipid-transporting ATPase